MVPRFPVDDPLGEDDCPGESYQGPGDVYGIPPLSFTSNTIGANEEALHGYDRHHGRSIVPTSGARPMAVNILADRPRPAGPLYDSPGTIIIYERAQWEFYDVRKSTRHKWLYTFDWRCGKEPVDRVVNLPEDTVGDLRRPNFRYGRDQAFADSHGYRWRTVKRSFQANDNRPEWHYYLVPLGDPDDSRAEWKRESELYLRWVPLQLNSRRVS